MEFSPLVKVTPNFELAVLRRISSGAFGEVYKAKIARRHDSVACKVARSTTAKWEFVHEVNLMADLNHENVVKLIGISNHTPIPWLILELMPHGDLLDFINGRREEQVPVCTYLWTRMSLDIAKGMDYLHWTKLLVHCDLHSRNCMVGIDYVVKVGDFGLSFKYESEEIEQQMLLFGETGQFGRPETPPLKLVGARWKAPELIPGRHFRPILTRPCDVWAYGILLFELWTEGHIPYDAVPDANLYAVILSGGNPLSSFKHVVIAPERILELMRSTWYYRPNDRPTFPFIVKVLEEVLEKLPPPGPDSDTSGSGGSPRSNGSVGLG